jgi:hypothetical protein
MAESDLGKLRRARIRCNVKLKQTEALLEGYQAHLADLEARIYALAPELDLRVRTRKHNPIFGRGELTSMALSVLREAGEPLPVRVIVVRMLAMKGIPLPDRHTRHEVRRRVRIMFCALDKRGVTVRVGEGRESRRGLASSRP